MANSILSLPGKFEDGTVYALKGETLNAWVKALQADRVICGPGQTEYQQPYGRVILGGIATATNYKHPWKVVIFKKLNIWNAKVAGGRVFNHELSATCTEVEMSDPDHRKELVNVVNKDVVCLKYTYDPEKYEIVKVAADDFKVLHIGDASGFNSVTYKPLAKIVAK